MTPQGHFKRTPDPDEARIALKLLLGEEIEDPLHLIDQARAWLKECFARDEEAIAE